MTAPELPTKIYFTILDMGSGYVYTPSLDDNGGTEYIRKDALIEWLLKGVEMSEICHSEYGDACAQAYQAVINKLDSM